MGETVLKACPFCGSDKPIAIKGHMGLWRAKCAWAGDDPPPGCGAETRVHGTREEAIAAWNLRAQPPLADNDELVVEQVDREAAAALVEWQNGTGWEPQFFHPGLPAGMREGVWDNHDVVQAFAKHRRYVLAALSRPAQQSVVVEALREAREAIAPFSQTWAEAQAYEEFDGYDRRESYIANSVLLAEWERLYDALAKIDAALSSLPTTEGMERE